MAFVSTAASSASIVLLAGVGVASAAAHDSEPARLMRPARVF